MIRPTKPEDKAAVIAVASTIGFQDAELAELDTMLANYFAGSSDADTSAAFWLTDLDESRGVLGLAYCEPERMTDQTWNLQLIAIHPDHQGQGRGSALLQAVEQTVVARGGRMLLVETSGLPSFGPTRGFYSKCHYEQEARIRDFYTAGEDKIVFRKLL
ncbi:MAG: GNAT family N-acetyltransferase [Elainella sp.]